MEDIKKKKNKKAEIKNWFRVLFGRGFLAKAAFAILIIFVFVAIFADYISPYDPLEQDLLARHSGITSKHWLGTDNLGRDVLSRLIHGASISLYSSILSGLLGAAIGIVLGLVAGYFGGALSTFIMRFSDIQLSIPGIILTIVLSSVMGGGIWSLVISIGIGMVPMYIRMMNGLVMSIKENDYVIAANLIGLKKAKILFRHLFPNCFPSLIVLFTMNLGQGIMMEATLSYLGLGVNPPTPTWGGMVAEGYAYLTRDPVLAIAPGICIILVIISFNILGDGLRDAMDPRLKGKV
jgi:peptide/nickel transport system permease protein